MILKDLPIEELYQILIDSYSSKNLNQITGNLILLYKSKNFSKIREISNKISKYVEIDEEKDAKCFSKLVRLYHPDKGEQIRTNIHKFFKLKNIDGLKTYSHILHLKDIDKVAEIEVLDIDYNPEYGWDVVGRDGFSFNDSDEEIDVEEFERSFFNLIKMREYGNIDIELPYYYLEDIEEFELSYCGVESLDGVEHCKHIKILDVSNNLISDITNLWDLENLEEIYMPNNQIGYIDALSNLVNLKIIDLSYNQIDDIGPLLSLSNLEFVNLIGNSINEHQVSLLKEKAIIVMY